jgi:hypothetical protein
MALSSFAHDRPIQTLSQRQHILPELMHLSRDADFLNQSGLLVISISRQVHRVHCQYTRTHTWILHLHLQRPHHLHYQIRSYYAHANYLALLTRSLRLRRGSTSGEYSRPQLTFCSSKRTRSQKPSNHTSCYNGDHILQTSPANTKLSPDYLSQAQSPVVRLSEHAESFHWCTIHAPSEAG